MSQTLDPKLTPLDKPTPREPATPTKAALIELQNRRREHLARHPSYLTNLEHETTAPVLYERLIKRFQTAAERAAEGKKKGYGRTLEADLLRGETKLSQMDPSRDGPSPAPPPKTDAYLDKPWDQPAEDREAGTRLWRVFLAERFVQGDDEDFDYAAVDGNEDYGVVARQDALERWFEDEEPSEEADDAVPGCDRVGETGLQDF